MFRVLVPLFAARITILSLAIRFTGYRYRYQGTSTFSRNFISVFSQILYVFFLLLMNVWFINFPQHGATVHRDGRVSPLRSRRKTTLRKAVGIFVFFLFSLTSNQQFRLKKNLILKIVYRYCFINQPHKKYLKLVRKKLIGVHYY